MRERDGETIVGVIQAPPGAPCLGYIVRARHLPYLAFQRDLNAVVDELKVSGLSVPEAVAEFGRRVDALRKKHRV